jgi:hypothetical protein
VATPIDAICRSRDRTLFKMRGGYTYRFTEYLTQKWANYDPIYSLARIQIKVIHTTIGAHASGQNGNLQLFPLRQDVQRTTFSIKMWTHPRYHSKEDNFLLLTSIHAGITILMHLHGLGILFFRLH